MKLASGPTRLATAIHAGSYAVLALPPSARQAVESPGYLSSLSP